MKDTSLFLTVPSDPQVTAKYQERRETSIAADRSQQMLLIFMCFCFVGAVRLWEWLSNHAKWPIKRPLSLQAARNMTTAIASSHLADPAARFRATAHIKGVAEPLNSALFGPFPGSLRIDSVDFLRRHDRILPEIRSKENRMKKPELIVALDVQNAASAIRAADALPPAVTFFKIGLELFTSEGPAVLAPISARNKRIFLDLKLHDIPNTVAQAVTSAGRHKVALLTVHSTGGRAMLSAAAEAAAKLGPDRPRIVAVTTLTSLAQADLTDIGVTRELREHTLALGQMAVACGIDGLVCSAQEVAAFRKALGPEPILVTPGIRPAGADVGDQKRVATPASAVRDGANFLVVGRPILAAPDPRAAAEAILADMEKALKA